MDAVDFIKGSVATSNLVPQLQNVTIDNYTISASDGIMSATALMREAQVSATINGKDLFVALKSVGKNYQLELTKSLKLKITDGKLVVFINTVPIYTHDIGFNTELQPLTKKRSLAILKAISILLPFVSTVTTIQWANGILFRGKFAYATDNRVMLRMYTGVNFATDLVIPLQGLREIKRLNIQPSEIYLDALKKCVFLKYTDTIRAMLRINTLDVIWPHIEDRFKEMSIDTCIRLKSNFFEKIKRLVPHVDNTRAIYVNDGKAYTTRDLNSGAKIRLTGINNCAFSIDALLKLNSVATAIDFTQYPKACPFIGNHITGIIAGII